MENSSQVFVSVLLESVPDGEKDFIQSFLVKPQLDGAILVQEVILELKKMGFPLDFNEVSFYSEENGAYIFCGMEPLPLHMVIVPEDYIPSKTVSLISGKGHSKAEMRAVLRH